MSQTIDQKVVEMRFDNKQFESNIKTSMSSIDKLKQNLNFDGVSKGLDTVSAAAKNCDVSSLGRAAETVQAKFGALEVMAVTALANITNSAINAGKRIVSALTIQFPKDGLAEYELQINSTQTIMANTGRTVQDVNAALDELNEYADLTIYNFSEMTKNAGMFTSAGLGLEDTMIALNGQIISCAFLIDEKDKPFAIIGLITFDTNISSLKSTHLTFPMLGIMCLLTVYSKRS